MSMQVSQQFTEPTNLCILCDFRMYKPVCLIADGGLASQCFGTSPACLEGCWGKVPGPQRCKAPQCRFEWQYLFLTFCERRRKKETKQKKKAKKQKLAVIQSLCKVTGNLPEGFSESRLSSPHIYIKCVVFCISKWWSLCSLQLLLLSVL